MRATGRGGPIGRGFVEEQATIEPAPPEPALDMAARTGVLLYDATVAVDTIMAEAVRSIQAGGIQVGGLLQHAGPRHANGRPSLWLGDIATGQSIRLDQPRGTGARDCILDPDALAQGACLLRAAAGAGFGLIVVNRFGYAEAEGGGLRAEIAEAMCSGAALLIAVRLSRLASLEAFLGGPATVLPAAATAIAAWAAQAVGQSGIAPGYA